MTLWPRKKGEALFLLGALAVLMACVYYLTLLRNTPDPGILWDSSTWVVTRTLVPCTDPQCLRPGDRLLTVDGVPFEDFQSNRNRAIFAGAPPYAVTFEREGTHLATLLPVQSGDLLSWINRGAKTIFVLLFWLVGCLVLALVRPRDERWAMMGIFCNLSALFFAAGFISFSHLAYSSTVTRITGALFLPVVIHVHFLLPEPRWPRLKAAILPWIYATAGTLILVDLFDPIPAQIFYLAPTLGIFASLALLAGHFVGRRDTKVSRAARLMITGIFLGTFPILATATLGWAGHVETSQRATITFQALTISFALANWPLAYLLALRQSRIFRWEIRANRALGIYGFWSVYLLIFLAVCSTSFPYFQDQPLAGLLVLACPFILGAPATRHYFQQLLDRKVLGIEHTPGEVVSLFAQRIPTAFERPQLISLITEQILPTLLIRQSALILLRDEGRRSELLCGLAIGPADLPAGPEELAALELAAGAVLPSLAEDPFPAGLERLRWMRLVLPLAVQQEPIGYWLFGRRDPDDDYPSDDIQMLTALANQIAAVVRVQEGLAEREKLQGQLVQSQKMEAVGRLSAGIAHDFNNFLSAILGYNELLSSVDPADPLAREYVEGIREAGEKASALTTQLLAFSRRQARAERLVDVSQLIKNLGNLLKRVLPSQVQLVLEMSELPLVVKVDSGHLEQVLVNLAVNAGDAMPEGGKLVVRTARRELPRRAVALAEMPAGTWAQIEVEDTGSGIAPDLLEHIFEPFYTTKKHGEGTGLGLAMVYGIIERSKGFIEVRSALGQGTCFTLYLPIAQGEPSVNDPVSVLPELPSILGDGKVTVLVVEDEPGVRKATAELLRTRGLKVMDAPDGFAALELCDQYEGDIHVLLTDVMMPHLQGPELADRLLVRRPGLSVVFMSGYNEESLLEYHLDKKHAMLIRKPFHQNDLLLAISQALALRTSSEQEKSEQGKSEQEPSAAAQPSTRDLEKV